MSRRRRRLVLASVSGAFTYYYLVDESGNNIVDESGNLITIKRRVV